MTDPRATLTRFETYLEREGEAWAPNGAHYRLETTEDAEARPCVVRTWEGEPEKVLGFNMTPFDTRDSALRWAKADARLVYERGRPLSERESLERYDSTVCAIPLNGEKERVAVVERFRDEGDAYFAVYEDEHGVAADFYPRRNSIGEAMRDAGELFESVTGGCY